MATRSFKGTGNGKPVKWPKGIFGRKHHGDHSSLSHSEAIPGPHHPPLPTASCYDFPTPLAFCLISFYFPLPSPLAASYSRLVPCGIVIYNKYIWSSTHFWHSAPKTLGISQVIRATGAYSVRVFGLLFSVPEIVPEP